MQRHPCAVPPASVFPSSLLCRRRCSARAPPPTQQAAPSNTTRRAGWGACPRRPSTRRSSAAGRSRRQQPPAMRLGGPHEVPRKRDAPRAMDTADMATEWSRPAPRCRHPALHAVPSPTAPPPPNHHGRTERHNPEGPIEEGPAHHHNVGDRERGRHLRCPSRIRLLERASETPRQTKQ